MPGCRLVRIVQQGVEHERVTYMLWVQEIQLDATVYGYLFTAKLI